MLSYFVFRDRNKMRANPPKQAVIQIRNPPKHAIRIISCFGGFDEPQLQAVHADAVEAAEVRALDVGEYLV